ncbi:hypothetical protein [Chamaesiphon minutus]|nr:hypothetical protein [Chamaesiphon minutus]
MCPTPILCRNCRFFQPDGRERGRCDKMNVDVKGEWKACQLALLAFCTLG